MGVTGAAVAKATIEFELPREQEEYDCCMQAPQMERTLRDIKHSFERYKEKPHEPAISQLWFEHLLHENGVKL